MSIGRICRERKCTVPSFGSFGSPVTISCSFFSRCKGIIDAQAIDCDGGVTSKFLKKGKKTVCSVCLTKLGCHLIKSPGKGRKATCPCACTDGDKTAGKITDDVELQLLVPTVQHLLSEMSSWKDDRMDAKRTVFSEVGKVLSSFMSTLATPTGTIVRKPSPINLILLYRATLPGRHHSVTRKLLTYSLAQNQSQKPGADFSLPTCNWITEGLNKWMKSSSRKIVAPIDDNDKAWVSIDEYLQHLPKELVAFLMELVLSSDSQPQSVADLAFGDVTLAETDSGCLKKQDKLQWRF